MLAGLDRSLEVLGPEVRRCCQDDSIDAAVQQLLIRIETDEPALLGHVHLIGQAVEVHTVIAAFGPLAQHVVRGIELISKQIGHSL